MANPNGNPQNLKPVRTKKEAKKRGTNGGIASGKARRRKRDMKEATKLLLDMPVAQESVIKGMKALGFNDEDLTNQMAMVVSIWKEAMTGNVNAATWIRDTAGEKQEHIQNKDEFEYKKERDAGISLEMEDMSEIEEEIYGTGKNS